MFEVEPGWDAPHPGAAVGILVLRGVVNPAASPALEAEKGALTADLRARLGELTPAELRATPPLPAYAAYYKRFGQRYHVAMQLESVVRRGRDLPAVAALVEAMFVAELRTLVLTAGHDLDALALPLRLRLGTGGEGDRYRTLGGGEATAKAGDLCIADGLGVVSAVVTGPDARTAISAGTTAALFSAYGPPGVGADAVAAHLDELERSVRLIAPAAEVAFRRVVPRP